MLGAGGEARQGGGSAAAEALQEVFEAINVPVPRDNPCAGRVSLLLRSGLYLVVGLGRISFSALVFSCLLSRNEGLGSPSWVTPGFLGMGRGTFPSRGR